MDISDIYSTEYTVLDPETRVSKLVGVLDDPDLEGVVVAGDEYEGVVTRRQLATSRHQPDEKLASLVWSVPRLDPDADVREVAGLMVDSDAHLLPVFEGDDLVGVVTADDILRAVEPSLDAATVREVASTDLVTVEPTTGFGEVLHLLREERIAHLPVVEGDTAVGIVSLYDVLPAVVDTVSGSQGGDAGGTDAFGGDISESSGRTHGGYGAREGEAALVRDLPVRDVMVSPVRTVDPAATLRTAVDEMFDVGGSSLVVTENGAPHGIVTTTDLLDALTWEAEGSRAVQVYGTDHLDDVSYDDVTAMVDRFDERDGDTSVLDAKVHLQQHDEQRRGTPLLLARVRLHTDRGQFIASGEGYGARQALDDAAEAIERQLRDEKTRGRSKKHPDEAYWERRFGWWLEAE